MLAISLVREDEGTSNYIHHDQLFKELIHTFFAEFLEAFFPEVYEYIDFSAIRPLSEETFTDFFEGENRIADIVIETKLKGQETVIIIHIETQSSVQTNFQERMYQYFSLLYNKYRKPILPIAVFTYNEKRNERDEFTIEFPFFHVLRFHFLTLVLRNMDWRSFIMSNNPVAAALLSKMGYNEAEKIEVKKEFLRMLVRMKLNPAKERYIYGFFERYLKLTEEEEGLLLQEINKLDEREAVKIMELPISYEERGIEKGKKIGEEIGKSEALKQVTKKMLKEGVAVEIIERVTQLTKEEIESIRKG